MPISIVFSDHLNHRLETQQNTLPLAPFGPCSANNTLYLLPNLSTNLLQTGLIFFIDQLDHLDAIAVVYYPPEPL
jgi:hypothetical protein